MHTKNNGSKLILQEVISSIQDVLKQAKNLQIPLYNTASLSTINSQCEPSIRMVTICDVSTNGLLIFMNKNSGKVAQIEQNPAAGLCFYWHALHIQVIVQGKAIEVSREESASFWAKQDRNFQLSAWVSAKPSEAPSTKTSINTSQKTQEEKRHNSENIRNTLRSQFSDSRIPLPEHWTAYRIQPTRIEYWQANWKSLSERHSYTQTQNGWIKENL